MWNRDTALLMAAPVDAEPAPPLAWWVLLLVASSPDGDDDDDDFDYGWDDSELGFTMPGKLSPEQVGLAKPVRIRAFTVRISHT